MNTRAIFMTGAALVMLTLAGCNDSTESPTSQSSGGPPTSGEKDKAKAQPADLPAEPAPEQPEEAPAPGQSTLPVALGVPNYESDNPPPTMLSFRDGKWDFKDGDVELTAPSKPEMIAALEKARGKDELAGHQGEVFLSAPADCPAGEIFNIYRTCTEALVINFTLLAQNAKGETTGLPFPINRISAVLPDAKPISIRLWDDGKITVGDATNVVATPLDGRELPKLDEALGKYVAERANSESKLTSATLLVLGSTTQRLVDVVARLQAHKISNLRAGTAEDVEFLDIEEEPPKQQPPRGKPRRITPPPVPPPARRRPSAPQP